MTEIKATRARMYNRHWHVGYTFRGPADHADQVLRRYLRRIKYTCFDRDEHDAFVRPLAGKLYSKHPCGMCRCKIAEIVPHWGQCWVNGEYVHLDDKREMARIKALHALAQKVKRLENRMERALVD